MSLAVFYPKPPASKDFLPEFERIFV